MSSFTQFTAEEQLRYCIGASDVLGKDYWEVVNGFRYWIGSIDSNRWVDIPAGYLTDGASIPRALWWILPPLGKYSAATTVHDMLCNTYYVMEMINGVETQVPVTRKEIDEILYEAMKVLQVEQWKQTSIELGVNFYRLVARPTKPSESVKLASAYVDPAQIAA